MKKLIALMILYLMFRGGRKLLTDKEKEIDVLARTIWGEARGEGTRGMQAVANVIMNRVNALSWFGNTIEGVCKKPYQFSCWNANDPNSSLCQQVNATDVQFQQCKNIATLAVTGRLADITNGANHYHAVGIRPNWADDSKKTVTIGNHVFYKL